MQNSRDKIKFNYNSNTSSLFFTLISVSSVIITLLYSIVLSVISTVSGNNALDFTSSNLGVLLSYALSAIIFLLAFFVFYIKFKVTPFKLLKKQQPKPSLIVYISAMLIVFGSVFGLGEVNYMFIEFLFKLGLTPPSVSIPTKEPLFIVLTILVVCFVLPLLEELIFRGVILEGYKEKGEILSIIISGALFSLFHMSPAQTVYQFIIGLLFGFIAIRGGSILPCVFAHVLNNLFVILNEYFFNITLSTAVNVILIIVGILSIVLGVVLLVKFTKKPETPKPEQSRGEFKFTIIIGIVICAFTWISNLFIG